MKVKNPKPQESSSPPNEPQPDIPKLFETKIKANFDGKMENVPSIHDTDEEMATTVNISDPSWLSHRKGEILYTDGIQRYSGPGMLPMLLILNYS